MADFEANLRAVLATLEGCHASLVRCDDCGTAQLVSVAILELRSRLNGIEAVELNALCDAMLREIEAPGTASGPLQPKPLQSKPLQSKPQAGLRPPIALKLVK